MFENQNFNLLILFLLLVILGIVSVHYYTYFSADNGVKFGAGFGAGLLTSSERNK